MTPRGRRRAAPARRSHAERTAETRAKVMGAVVESIADVGFQRTTAAEITRRAGVSWGAVQHHFGDKEGILDAVLADSFARFAERLADVDLERLDLEARVDVFVDRAWEHFGSPHYRSTFEILLNHPSGEGDAWRGMLAAWNDVWSRFFPTPHRTRREVVALQLYAISLLSGLATARALGGPAARLVGGPLALLREALVEQLAPPS
ncbi:MAG TPA: TetR/AcrR family transcriptional regulator [Myxococcota bacterium]|nr:TetR/AcrR family transcriptional regulator [Myxococcota bacterium]